MKFTIMGVTDNNALLTTIENGLTIESDSVAIGAKADRTINPKASAPPNSPNLQSTSTRGATIKENPTPNNAWVRSGSKNNRITEITPKIIHIKSLISRLRMSIIVAEPNITRANKILIWKISNSSMIYFLPDYFSI
jgi:hypothetical protein